MRKSIIVIIASVILALKIVTLGAAQTSETFYEQENGVWTGVSNQYFYTDGVVTKRIKRTYDADENIQSRVEYNYTDGIWNGQSDEVLFDINGERYSRKIRNYDSVGVLAKLVEYGYQNGSWNQVSIEKFFINYEGASIAAKKLTRNYENDKIVTSNEVTYDRNGEWDGSRTLAWYNKNGKKIKMKTVYLNGKGEIKSLIISEWINDKAGWQNTHTEDDYTDLYLIHDWKFDYKIGRPIEKKVTAMRNKKEITSYTYSYDKDGYITIETKKIEKFESKDATKPYEVKLYKNVNGVLKYVSTQKY